MAKKRRAKMVQSKSKELLPQQTNVPDLHFELLSRPRALAGVLAPFRAEHSAWWERYRNGPIYSLPEPVVNHLAQTTPSVSTLRQARKALINANDAVAEHAFRQACHRYGADTVGFWNEKAIRFGLLNPSHPTSSVSTELITKEGWDASLSPVDVQRELKQLETRSDPSAPSLVGLCGRPHFQ